MLSTDPDAAGLTALFAAPAPDKGTKMSGPIVVPDEVRTAFTRR